jgi:hypothetical protein
MLAGLLYHGSIVEPFYPNKEVFGYLGESTDPETGNTEDYVFSGTPFESDQTKFDRIRRLNSMQYFCLTHAKYLGLGMLDSDVIYSALSNAKIVSRGD